MFFKLVNVQITGKLLFVVQQCLSKTRVTRHSLIPMPLKDIAKYSHKILDSSYGLRQNHKNFNIHTYLFAP